MTTHATALSVRSKLAHGLAPDPALPARDDLLNPQLVTNLLSVSLGSLGDSRLAVSDAELLRVKYRIGESLRVLYRIRVAGGSMLVTGRMFVAGRSAAAYRKAAGEGSSSEGVRATMLDSDRDTVWWTFPNDRRLVGLDAVLDPTKLSTTLRSAVGDWSASEVVQYAPERSVTLQARGRAGQTLAFVKCYAPDTLDVADLAGRYDLVASRLRTADPTLCSPRALAHSRERRLLILEPMPGRSWLELDRFTAVDALRRLGLDIAVVHATPLSDNAVSGLRRFGRLDHAHLVRAGDLISQARPDVARAVRRLVDRLVSSSPGPLDQVLLHGDCHPGNVIVDDERVSLIDLDQAGRGPAAADMGSLLARLTYGTALGETDHATANAMASAFLDGYSQLQSLPDEQTLGWYAAAALLAERSLRAVNRIRPEALAHLEDLVGAGNDLVDGRTSL